MKTTHTEDTFGSKAFKRWRKARTSRTIRRSVRCLLRRTVTARFDSEVQAFYTATYPLRTDTDYQRALREAAALAFKRGL